MCDHANREAAMVTVERHPDGTPKVWCDPCIADLVRVLNQGGLPTIASCCGHGKQDGSIVLADGRELRLSTFDAEREREAHPRPVTSTPPAPDGTPTP